MMLGLHRYVDLRFFLCFDIGVFNVDDLLTLPQGFIHNYYDSQALVLLF